MQHYYVQESFPKGRLQVFLLVTIIKAIIEANRIVFVAVFLGCTSTGRVGLWFLWFYVQELPRATLENNTVVKFIVTFFLKKNGNFICENLIIQTFYSFLF